MSITRLQPDRGPLAVLLKLNEHGGAAAAEAQAFGWRKDDHKNGKIS